MANTYLSKTYGSSGNRQRQAISVWVKRGKLADTQTIFWSNGGASHYAHLRFKSDDSIQYYANNVCNLKTNRKFKDTNAWYHICVTLDTPQATESNRLKIYINGVAETSFSTASYPSQNAEVKFADDNIHYIGQSDSGSYFDGSMSHFHFVTNTAYAASTFGETDATTGEWKINTSPTVTYATNSFFVLKDGNSGTDQSGQGNNYSVANGTLTKTEDCPSNVFATLNPLVPYSGNLNFTNGNTTMASDGGGASWTTRWGVSTLGMSSGKYYAEAKVGDIGSNQMYALGLCRNVGTFAPSSSVAASGNNGLGYYSTGNIYTGGAFSNSDNDQTGVATFTTNDIIGLAFDRTNGTAQWYKNGSTVGNAVTGLSTDGIWHFVSNFYNTGTSSINFGNGYFGTTAVASAGTNASGNGIFEYDVPTGYTALSTKGLDL